MLTVVLLSVGAAVRGVDAHPKPGAHADVRVDISSSGVKFDVLMNALFVDGLVTVPRERRDDVMTAEEEPIFRAVAEYYGVTRAGAQSLVSQRPNVVRIDGIEVRPVIRTIEVVRPEPETRPGFIQNPALLIPRVHIVAEYLCAAPPKQVSMIWGTYPRDFLANERDVPPTADIEAVLTGYGQLDIITFTQSEPEYVWHAPASMRQRMAIVPPIVKVSASHRVPVIAIAFTALAVGAGLRAGLRPAGGSKKPFAASVRLCLFSVVLAAAAWAYEWPSARQGPAGDLSDIDAAAVFGPLHTNIYRAFDYSRESDIYDALATSVDGPMLDTVYNDVYRALVMQEEGGALSRVKNLTPISTTILSHGVEAGSGSSQFEVEANWRVQGVVYHWGHSHERTSEHAARYLIAARPAGWRIVGVVPVSQQRMQSPEQAQSAASMTGSQAIPAPAGGEGTRWHPPR